MATPYVVTSRMILIGAAWTGTAPGPGVTTPAGTITSTSDLSAYTLGGGEPVYNANMVDVTNMGSIAFSCVIPGITSADDLTIDANSDNAASQLRSMISTVFGTSFISRPGDAAKYIDIKATSAARSATNPSFVGAVFLKKWMPAGGAVGSGAKASAVFAVTGTFLELTA